MTPHQIETMPAHLLYEKGTRGLRDWLDDRGLSLSLLELTHERIRRNQTPRSTPQWADRRNYR